LALLMCQVIDNPALCEVPIPPLFTTLVSGAALAAIDKVTLIEV
jgi:hypothetical protein